MEKIVYEQLLKHASDHTIFTPQQFGFLKNHSTTDCILNFLNKLHESTPENKYSIGISLDLCKAFDSINHTILLEKLKFYGVKNKSLEWFNSYLSGRKQYTSCNNIKSSMASINNGVPQGSILGPLLFLYFINDLVNCSESLYLSLFADDSTGLISGNNLDNLRQLATEELQKVADWLSANKIRANLKKSHFLVFKGRNKLDYSLRITLNGKSLAQKSSTKMLGVHIRDDLKWTEHINVINRKISRTNGILYKLSKTLNSKTLKLVYNSLVHPHLQYSNIIWGNAPMKLLNMLSVSQKRAIRTICHSEYLAHTNALLKNLGIIKVVDIHMLESVKFVKKELSKPASLYFSFRQNNHNMVLRNNIDRDVTLPQPLSDLARRFITYSGALHWNSLPRAIKMLTHPVTFKRNVKKLIISRY